MGHNVAKSVLICEECWNAMQSVYWGYLLQLNQLSRLIKVSEEEEEEARKLLMYMGITSERYLHRSSHLVIPVFALTTF